MNPLSYIPIVRHLPGLLFIVLLLLAVPFAYEFLTGDSLVAAFDCDDPRNDEEEKLCDAAPEMEKARETILEGVEIIHDRLDH